MAKNQTRHEISVSKVYWLGGYAVSCSKCKRLGRGMDKDRKKARKKAWNMGQKHATAKNGGGTLGA